MNQLVDSSFQTVVSPLQGFYFFTTMSPGCYPGLSCFALTGHRREEAKGR